ncbi:MAG: DMT family transporter [Bdellovibrionota bacterium]
MNPKLGLTYALFAAASYAIMSYLVHWNPFGFSVPEMTLVRGLVTVAGVLPFCWRDLGLYFRKDASLLWLRGLLGAAGLFLYYYTLQGTVSANANFLFWGSTPLFVSVLSWMVLREKLSRAEGAGVALVLAANVLLYIPTRSSMPLWVWETGIAGGFVSSLAYLTLGSATKRYSSPLIVLSFGGMSVVFAALWPGGGWVMPTQTGWGFLLLAGLLGLLSQLFTTFSFAHLNGGVATALGRTSILFGGVLDIGLAGYRPHWLEWLSYLVVVAGAALSQVKPKKS